MLNLSEKETTIISSIQDKRKLELKENRNILTRKEIEIFDYYNALICRSEILESLLSKF